MYKSCILVLAVLLCRCSLAQSVPQHPAIYNSLEQIQVQVLAAPEQALARLEQMPMAQITDDPNLHMLWLLRKAEAYRYTYQTERFDEILEQAQTFAGKPLNPSSLAMLQVFDGIRKQRKGDYSQAITALNTAITTARDAGQGVAQIKGLTELAFTHSLAEQYEEALSNLQRAYQLASAANLEFFIAYTEETYGAIYSYMGKHQESIQYYQKARLKYLDLGYPFFIGESAFGIATTYRAWGKYELAEGWYREYWTYAQNYNASSAQFLYRYGLGMTLALKGECEQALSIIAPALEQNDWKDYRVELYKRAAVCHAKSNRFEQAHAAIETAGLLYDELPELAGTRWSLELIKIRSQVSAAKGDFRQAHAYLADYHHKYLEVLEETNSRALEKMRLTFKNEREGLALAVLENQSQVQEYRLDSQNQKIENQRLWLSLVILMFVVALSFILWQFRVSRKLKSLSITDELTGLSNRRFMFATMERLLTQASAKNTHHSLMLIDVDNLKPINDEYGHQVGDRVLKSVARQVNSVLRSGDVFARIGGDEFMLLLTRTDSELEISIAERIIHSINDNPLLLDSGKPLELSVSIGIAAIENLGESPASVYGRVDAALYRAKASGRNSYYR